MPTLVSQSTLCELGRLIAEACVQGDNVSAIAERAGVSRTLVSQLRNGSCVGSPTIDKVVAILEAIGESMQIPPHS
ncbi:helix-turn-helix domain-containing protein [Aureliella helgolandensis]|uniref:Helix-turn-helix protein n=1 Tax=Aureliella helgolandensis TaxID=2527968 RepID=A0A518G4D7_9BACT|nr:helix-turn-helix transcriptional regulator [Aureliella helgolandensis]QDV23464.1 helix-turn-helix protein [Aureliella helgolandensis]